MRWCVGARETAGDPHSAGDRARTSVARTIKACARNLVAGAFDFIVTPDDEWVYLEVNEAGQFIFVEQWCPELTLFDAFCAFVESGDPDFVYKRPASPQTLEALQEAADPERVCADDDARRSPPADPVAAVENIAASAA